MAEHRYFYPKSDPTRRPPPWWYVGWVIYANRATFYKGFLLFGGITLALFAGGLLLRESLLLWAALGTALLSALILANSVLGLTLVYGPPARRYVRELLHLGGVGSAERVADLHIGTYRISYILADLLPGAHIESVDIWDDERYQIERALVLLRQLELPPVTEPRVHSHRTADETVPLPDGSCDVVVLGLGLHEIPEGSSRERIMSEARRILKPGGVCLLFEHTVDFQSFLVFGPEIDHWVRREEWRRLLEETFGPPVKHRRSGHAVDLFYARPGARQ